MSRAITVASILILILAMSFWGIWYAREVREEFDTLTAEAQSRAEAGDCAGLARQAERMLSQWETRETVLSFYVRHDLLEQMTQSLLQLKSYAHAGELPNALVTLERLRFLTGHIYERELPSWNNVF